MYWPVQRGATLWTSFEFGVDNDAALRAGVLEALTTSLTGRFTYDVVGTTLGARERLLHVTRLSG